MDSLGFSLTEDRLCSLFLTSSLLRLEGLSDAIMNVGTCGLSCVGALLGSISLLRPIILDRPAAVHLMSLYLMLIM